MQQYPEEVRAEYVRVMSSELGSLCHDLQQEVDCLYDKWDVFRELFEQGPERNKPPLTFFIFFASCLFEDAMLHLCRLTDPPDTRVRTQGKMEIRHNLTVMGLERAISDSVLSAKVRAEAHRVKRRCGFAREWRNRRLAHTDLKTSRSNNSGLPSVSADSIRDGLKSTRTLLNLVEEYYDRPPFGLLPDPWGAKSLVWHLEKSVRTDDES